MSDPGEYGDAPEIAEEIMAGFRRTTRGVSARFSSGQAGIIRNLVAQVAELVGGAGAAEPPPAGGPAERGEAAGEGLPVDLAAILAMDGPAAPPEDPVLATLPSDGGRVRLSAGDAEAWLRSLNDVRLALGVVLGISEDYEHEFRELGPEDQRGAYLHVYDWLTFLQESLVRALR